MLIVVCFHTSIELGLGGLIVNFGQSRLLERIQIIANFFCYWKKVGKSDLSFRKRNYYGSYSRNRIFSTVSQNDTCHQNHNKKDPDASHLIIHFQEREYHRRVRTYRNPCHTPPGGEKETILFILIRSSNQTRHVWCPGTGL